MNIFSGRWFIAQVSSKRAAIALFLMAAWPVNAANTQAYWSYGVGYPGVSGHTETRPGWYQNSASGQVG
jgi:hypothetical protein